jgi:hypothetical protein
VTGGGVFAAAGAGGLIDVAEAGVSAGASDPEPGEISDGSLVVAEGGAAGTTVEPQFPEGQGAVVAGPTYTGRIEVRR